MKKICFPVTNRVHLARQGLLIKELKKYFKVDIVHLESFMSGMSSKALDYGRSFCIHIGVNRPDAVLIRGDRYEVLSMALVSAYDEIPIIHIEGGDLSGVIDNKVRGAISKLADHHFSTNKESLVRLINMGIDPDTVWDFGSLDVEFAAQVKDKELRDKPFILVAHHPIQGEDHNEVNIAVDNFSDDYDIIKIQSNLDYGKGYGEEIYSPEDYINLLRYASCLVGNSSSFLKEASILGTGTVNVGTRQQGRLKPINVLDVPCFHYNIEMGIHYQLASSYKADHTYYKPNTSQRIAQKLKEILYDK